MSEKRKVTLKKGRGLPAILISTVIGLVLFCIILSVFSIIIANSNMDLVNLKYCLLIASLFSSFIAAMISAYKNRQMKGLIVGLLTSFFFTIFIMLVLLVINGFAVTSFTYSMMLLSVAVGIPAGIIGANLKR